MKKRLLVIDGKSIFYRGYYAMPHLSMHDGTPTGGVYGFAALALEAIKTLKPDYVAVAWDKPKTNIRRRLEIYPEYKAGRKPAPPDFYAQVPILHELLEAFGWPLYEYDDYEADDIMGTLSLDANNKGVETILITSDLDMLQLIDEDTHVYALKKGFSQIEEFNLASFEAKYGLKQHQFLDLKSLQGDSSDNIPGVPGVGAKTATTLLQKYETLDGIYEHIDEIVGSAQAKLIAGKESAYMSKEIAKIWTDAPIHFDADATDVHRLDRTKLRDMLEKLEFKTLLKNLPQGMKSDAPSVVESRTAPAAVVPFDDVARTTIMMAEYVMVMEYEDGFLVSANPDRCYSISNDVVIDVLAGSRIIAYDAKLLIKKLLTSGATVIPDVHHDIRQAYFLIDATRRSQSLEDVAGVSLESEAGIIMGVLWQSFHKQCTALQALPRVNEIAQKIDFPMVKILAQMEYRGITIDCPLLKNMSNEFGDKIILLEKQAFMLVGEEFNLASPKQLAEVLYGTLGLSTVGVKKGKTGFSTGQKELTKLHGLHPIIEIIEKHREISKLKNTYLDALPQLADTQSRLHTTFNQDGAATGRLSSNDPNLQNIPIRSEAGRRIREAFVPSPGCVFVSADYSQFELRLAAVLSNDVTMIEAFNNDEDIHVLTAAVVMGISPSDVTKEMRYKAKAVNFGILYGQGSHGLAEATGMNFKEAKDFIDRYYEIRPSLKVYMDSLRKKAHEDGFVETLLGRRRPTPDVKSSNFIVRSAAERAAMNMPIQGTAADLTKLAMIALEKAIDGLGYQLLQIHDSILVECEESEVSEVEKIMRRCMEQVYPELGVKLKVDVSSGKNWETV